MAASWATWTRPAGRLLFPNVLSDEISGGTGDGQGRDEYSNVHFH
jgi:hypothetical protein